MAGKQKPLILLTNDDGFFTEGINRLSRRLKSVGRVWIVAPDREKSAVSLSLSLHHPLRVQKIKPRVFAVDGSPADCIYLALRKLLPANPDLLISGPNPGPNLGQQDISYSGTVAGALQGTFLGIPSAAVSLLPDNRGKLDLGFAAEIVRKLADRLLECGLPDGLTLNVNIPPPPVKGIKMTCLGQKRYSPEIIEKKDPRQRTYYWIGTGKPLPLGNKGSDIWAVDNGYISITPLHTDLTDYGSFKNRILKKLTALTD